VGVTPQSRFYAREKPAGIVYPSLNSYDLLAEGRNRAFEGFDFGFIGGAQTPSLSHGLCRDTFQGGEVTLDIGLPLTKPKCIGIHVGHF
jgi:hypothetical protein